MLVKLESKEKSTTGIKIKIRPVPKPRMTRSDKWKKRPCVLKYWQFCDELRSKCGALALTNRVKIVFNIKMPINTWSKKKQAEKLNKPHDQKPDCDNMIKAVLDALHKDDSKIYSIFAEKYWSEEDSINIEFY